MFSRIALGYSLQCNSSISSATSIRISPLFPSGFALNSWLFPHHLQIPLRLYTLCPEYVFAFISFWLCLFPCAFICCKFPPALFCFAFVSSSAFLSLCLELLPFLVCQVTSASFEFPLKNAFLPQSHFFKKDSPFFTVYPYQLDATSHLNLAISLSSIINICLTLIYFFFLHKTGIMCWSGLFPQQRASGSMSFNLFPCHGPDPDWLPCTCILLWEIRCHWHI